MNTDEQITSVIYDTTINIIGGLKDSSIIYKAIDAYFNQDNSIRDFVSGRNEFNLRTERSRTRVERAVKRAFLQFRNQEHRDLIENLFRSNVSLPERELILFWQFALNNQLFCEISTQVFMKVYFSGRTGISKDDVVAWMKDFLYQNKQLNLNWSESTINTLATKYLNFMTKLNFLEGVRVKSFRTIKTSAESLVLFLYFTKLYNPQISNILESKILTLSFVSSKDLLERFKKLSLKGFFNMNFNGVVLNIELTHSFKGICDVLYNRS
ncbi:MAG: DUF1819 family protein [Spirochaetales bacterium]|nr:DUF1819 family protein [Spirochaetales bacterium]